MAAQGLPDKLTHKLVQGFSIHRGWSKLDDTGLLLLFGVAELQLTVDVLEFPQNSPFVQAH
jgi:hypothetical protein